MFKASENKSHKTPDAITGSDGRVLRRSDYEDPQRPGYTVPGRLYSSQELFACGKWGLTAPNGRPFASLLPVERPPDPSCVGRRDTPETLRRAADDAWKALDALRALSAAALERRSEAEAARHRAFENRDVQGVTRAEAEYKLFEQQRRDLELQEPPLRRAVAEAEDAVQRWTWDEMLRRQGRA
jgi:hypothetical protein